MIRVDSILHFLSYAKLISISIIHGILHSFTLLPVFSVFLRDIFTPFWYYGCLKRIEHGHIATECWTATECGLKQPLSLGSGQWILCLFWKISILIQIHDYRILQITPQFQGFHLSMDFGLLCHPPSSDMPRYADLAGCLAVVEDRTAEIHFFRRSCIRMACTVEMQTLSCVWCVFRKWIYHTYMQYTVINITHRMM
jgi:hypothetical protein